MQSIISETIRLCLWFSSIHIILTQKTQSCGLLQEKLGKYQISINSFPDHSLPGLRVCENFINNTCCPQHFADRIHNATLIELHQLFELHSMSFYQSLLMLNVQFNDTFDQLIQQARNETHELLQRGYHQLYVSYRFSVDKFFDNLLTLNSRNLTKDIHSYVDQLFENILHISLTLNKNQSISSNYFSCLWRHQPFGSSPNQLVKQLETHLAKLFQLNDLLRLSNELVQVLSTSVTTDYQCIDSFMQLSYCNLCGGRNELPCLNNCVDILQSCLVNITLIDNVWRTFLDSMENFAYFHGIEKVLSSIGLSISDAVMNFLNSGGVQNKNIISQCGHMRSRRNTLALEHQLDEERNSFLDRRLRSIKQSLELYRSFWKRFPEDICGSRTISAPLNTRCWTGTDLSEDGKRSSIEIHHEKLMNLKLQRILKDIKEKSISIDTTRLRPTVNDRTLPPIISPSINESKIDLINPSKLNELDDYPNENDFDYSEYAYEDATDQMTSTTTTTTTTTTTASTTISTVPMDDDSFDDDHTAYYDYGDSDAYSDDDVEETTTTRPTPLTTPYRRTTTSIWKDQIPFYHRRIPIIWKIDMSSDDQDQFKQRASDRNSADSLTYSLLLTSYLFLILIRV